MAAQAELEITKDMERKSQTLVAKLAEACAAVGFVPKRGENKRRDGTVNYNYVKATDVANALRIEFFSRNIILACDEKECRQTRTIKTNSGGEMAEFLVYANFTFHDGDTGQTLGPLGAFGIAMDTGDKAIYKAKTGALKYVLRGIGLIPDEDSDPETDEKVDEFVSRPHTSTPAQGIDVEFSQSFPSDYDDSQLLDRPPSKPSPSSNGGCKTCGGKVIPAGVSKKTNKPYRAFCKDCKAIQ